MIKFNWKTLNNYFDWKPQEVLKYFYYLSAIPMPSHIGKITAKDRKKIIELIANKDRYSYLVDSHSLLYNHSNVKQMYDYIHLASLRSLFDYNIRKTDWVNTWQVPRSLDLNNPLFTVDNGKIYLKYDSSITGAKNGN